MTKILVVEDNPKYGEGAETYFSGNEGISVVYAKDFDEAMAAVPEKDGAIIDCFFPYKTGSGNRNLLRGAMAELGAYDKQPTLPGKALIQLEDSGMPVEATKLFAKNAGVRYAPAVSYRRMYEKAAESSEANQPLGIFIAQMAEDLEIPFVLATSTFHHDELTQPIQNYCSRKGWTLIDCSPEKGDEKATPEFWERAYEALKSKM